MEKGLRFKQSSLIASNQQLSRGAVLGSSSHHKLEITKLLSGGIEPWSVMRNC